MTRRMTPAMLLSVATAFVALACSPAPESVEDAGTPDEGMATQTFEFTIGKVDDAGDFVPLEEGETMEIIVGFQGLIFIDVALLGPAEIPDRFAGDAMVYFDDEAQDFGFRDNFVDFEAPTTDHRLCPAFRVPFGQDLTLLDGQMITLDLGLAAEGWEGEAEATFRIVDEENCFEAANGEIECE